MKNSLKFEVKCSTCAFGALEEDQDPCKNCLDKGEFVFWKPTGTSTAGTSKLGQGSGREIGHQTQSTQSEPKAEEVPCSQTDITETCRAAIKRLEDAERVAKLNKDEEKQKAIHKLLQALRDTKPSTMVTIPVGPLTCPLEDFEKFSKEITRGLGRTR